MAKELTPEERLANAIVVQACRDYLEAKTKIRDYEDDEKLVKESESTIKSILRFFNSDWFNMLTNVKPEYLIRKLDEAFENGQTSIDYMVLAE